MKVLILSFVLLGLAACGSDNTGGGNNGSPTSEPECAEDSECGAEEVCADGVCEAAPVVCADTDPCDGEDNDCDGLVDEENTGLLTLCAGLGPDNTEPVQCIAAECLYACTAGNFDRDDDLGQPGSNGCECQPNSEPDVCDGEDNNCDGTVDEAGDDLLSECPAQDHATASSCDAGACAFTCDDGYVDVNGDLGEAGGDGCECVHTGDEVCDGQDNDCDGLTDEEDDTYVPTACAQSDGVCAGATQTCSAGTAVACVAVDYSTHNPAYRGDALETLCDGEDNNCDGQVDPICCGDRTDTSLAVTAPGENQRQLTPKIALGDDGLMLVTWVESTRVGDNEPDIGTVHWQLLSEDGGEVGSGAIDDGTKIAPAAVWTGDGFVVTSVTERSADLNEVIRVSPTGATGGDLSLVLDASVQDVRNTLLVQDQDSTHAIWTQEGGCSGGAKCIRSRSLSGADELGNVEEHATGPVFSPRAIFDAQGRMLMVYHDDSASASIQYLTPQGPVMVDSTTQLQNSHPDIAMVGDTVLIAYSKRVDGTRQVFLSIDGAAGVQISSGTDARSPRIAVTTEGVSVLWVEDGGSGEQIVMRHLDETFAVEGAPMEVLTFTQMQYVPFDVATRDGAIVLAVAGADGIGGDVTKVVMINRAGEHLCTWPAE